MINIPKNMTPEETLAWYEGLTPEEMKEFDDMCNLAIKRHKAYEGLKRQDTAWKNKLRSMKNE